MRRHSATRTFTGKSAMKPVARCRASPLPLRARLSSSASWLASLNRTDRIGSLNCQSATIRSRSSSLASSGGGAYTNYGIAGQSTMLMDGVNTRQDAAIDQGTGNGPDIGTVEEMQIVTVGGGAEQALPGVFLNMIVKTGGNQFHGRYEVQN